MTTELNLNLALAKQHFQDLMTLTTIDHLLNREYDSGPKRERIQELIGSLVSLTKAIEDEFSAYLDKADDAPIMHMDLELRDFYANLLEPNAIKLRDIFLNITGFGESLGVAGWEELLEGLNPSDTKTPIANAVSWGLERWWTMLDDGEQQDWLERGFNIEAAIDLVDKGFFAPDLWLENQRLLRPVLVARPLNTVPSHVQYRLREIYRSFVHGLWMSSIALSRSVAEYAIIDNGPRLGLEVSQEWRGKKEFKKLERLIDEVAAKYPNLRTPLEKVRTTGNRILHPKKKRDVEVISFPKVMREEALVCIKGTRLVVESLYSFARG
ncbi:MAG: hypothetical protein NT178_17700 [Proteobacteria bacterium]|nr:hypothetical protein [Pseudomonadota bacterium]